MPGWPLGWQPPPQRYNRTAVPLPAAISAHRSRFAHLLTSITMPCIRPRTSFATDRPRTLAQLRAAGWVSKTVKQEIHDNFLRKLQAGEELYPGIIGFDDTVLPELNIAILAQHDLLFLGEKGQAKSRLMRLVEQLSRRRDSLSRRPGDPAARRSRIARSPSAAAIAGRARARPTKCRSPGGRATTATPSGCRRARSSPTSSARSTRRSSPPA